MESFRLKLDRITSATRNAALSRDVLISPQIRATEGYVVAARVLSDKVTYNEIEDVSGRLIRLRAGDVLAGVLGRRRALKGYAGEVPESISVGDTLQLLNMGGIIGRCTSYVDELGLPFDVEILGAVLRIPAAGDRVGEPADILHGAIPQAEELRPNLPPVVYVAGTAMNSGKTVACVQIVRHLSKAGLKVAACKLTGVSLRRDALGMLDAGATHAFTFNDAGVATTHDHCAVSVARGIMNHLAGTNADVVVAELGDGILGEYGVADILEDPGLAAAGKAFVVCAPDQVAAWGAHELFETRFKLPITVMSGPVTDSGVGRDFIQQTLGVPAHNARHDADSLARAVMEGTGLAAVPA
ncbi:MAG: hypothetical protein M5R36_24070 [Deltaproteobacteria bacterium]|nr:hypothetical protein [Deltaproteobacteria bacterium]